jgi:HNH endonuclease
MSMGGSVVSTKVGEEIYFDARSLQHADYREIDRTLRAIAKRQRGSDAEEMTVLCIVARRRVWRELGRATLLEYVEDVFGYGPKVAHERIRVALAIDELTDLHEALATGEISYSALRELTRVATAATQQEWLASARGKNLRQVEDIVRTHRKGQRPSDPGDPDLAPVTMQVELSKAAHALIRHTRIALGNERGHSIGDEELYSAMANALLNSIGSNAIAYPEADPPTESDARIVVVGAAKHQVRVTVCERCDQSFFEGGGKKIAVGPADAELAQCDAQRIGADLRATQDVSPSTRREVAHRDGGKCSVPGCRSARHLEVHHIVPRHKGGTHDAGNLTLCCDGHHMALHDGKLVISGTAPKLTFRFVKDEPAVETSSKYALTVMKAEARQALAQLGFKGAAGGLVDAALRIDPNPSSLEQLIRAALRCSS